MTAARLLTAIATIENWIAYLHTAEQRIKALPKHERDGLAAIPDAAYGALVTHSLMYLPPAMRRRALGEMERAISAIDAVVQENTGPLVNPRRRAVAARAVRLIESMGERSLAQLEDFLDANQRGVHATAVFTSPKGIPGGWPEVATEIHEPDG